MSSAFIVPGTHSLSLARRATCGGEETCDGDEVHTQSLSLARATCGGEETRGAEEVRSVCVALFRFVRDHCPRDHTSSCQCWSAARRFIAEIAWRMKKNPSAQRCQCGEYLRVARSTRLQPIT